MIEADHRVVAFARLFQQEAPVRCGGERAEAARGAAERPVDPEQDAQVRFVGQLQIVDVTDAAPGLGVVTVHDDEPLTHVALEEFHANARRCRAMNLRTMARALPSTQPCTHLVVRRCRREIVRVRA